jgi:hypothetical protein
MLRLFTYQIRTNKAGGASFSQLRHYFKWKKSLHPEASSVKDEQPWITYDAIDFLKDIIKPQWKIFEYGGGGSTLFFTKRSCEVVTVEHNQEWFELLTGILAKKGVANWKGNYVLPESGNLAATPDKANPEHYSSGDLPSQRLNYKKYVSAIDSYPQEYFDVILVDGRSRPSCIKHSIPKLKKGGYLILDNSDRPYYLTFLEKQLKEEFKCILSNTGASPYSREFTRTTIWQRN